MRSMWSILCRPALQRLCSAGTRARNKSQPPFQLYDWQGRSHPALLAVSEYTNQRLDSLVSTAIFLFAGHSEAEGNRGTLLFPPLSCLVLRRKT